MSTEFRLQTVKGYSIEFWFMLNNVICPITIFTATDEFVYFYANPHIILWRNNKFYHRFIGTGTETDITARLHQYEWNKLVIMTDIVNNEITFYVNFFETPFIIPVSGSLDLKNIAFCTKKGNPKCTEQDITIKWESAYYNNIRIWDIRTASIEVIQGYHSKMYSETLKSHVLYYPLTISYLDNNKIENIISTLSDYLTITILSSDSMYNVDNIILYNYSSNCLIQIILLVQ